MLLKSMHFRFVNLLRSESFYVSAITMVNLSVIHSETQSIAKYQLAVIARYSVLHSCNTMPRQHHQLGGPERCNQNRSELGVHVHQEISRNAFILDPV